MKQSCTSFFARYALFQVAALLFLSPMIVRLCNLLLLSKPASQMLPTSR